MMKHVPSDEENRRFMMMAVEEAEIAIKSGDGTPFGGVIVQFLENSEPKFVRGHNLSYKNMDPTAHGEVCCTFLEYWKFCYFGDSINIIIGVPRKFDVRLVHR